MLEMMVVMAIIAIVAALTAPRYMDEINLMRAKSSAEETQMIVDAARVYRMKNSTWPGNGTCANGMSILNSEGMLKGIGAYNKYGSPYSVSCTQYTFSVDQNVTEDWDGYMVNVLAGTQIVNAGTYQIRTTIGIPGSEPGLDSKLSRIATGNAELNRMRTTLLLGGNDITEVGTINAVTGQFSGNVTTNGNVGANGNIGANGNVTANGNITAQGSVNGNTVNSSSSVNGVTGNFSDSVTASTGAFNSSVSAPIATFSNSVAARNLTVQEAASMLGTFWVQGTSQFSGTSSFDEAVELRKVVSEGQGGCVTGAIARNSSGKTLSCQNGVWKTNGGGEPQFMAVNIRGYANPDVSSHRCPTGWTKIGWDTYGAAWRPSESGGVNIGENDFSTVFCAKFD